MIYMAVPLKIGYLPTLYHTSFVLRASGRMDDLGIKATWKLFPNGPEMVEAFGREELDLGYLGLPPAMIGISRGFKIKCVAGGHVEGTILIGDRSCQVKEMASDALAQFKDRIIGTPRRGSIHDVVLREFARDCGLADSIEIKNFDWADFILDALMDGEIDGACGTPALAVLARRQGAKIILPPDNIWPFNPSYGIFAGERLILESPLTLENFLMLHEDACNLLRERPQIAASMMHNDIKIIDEDFAREVLAVSPKYCASLPDEYIDSSLAFVPVLRFMGYIDRDLDKEDVFWTDAIKRVHPHKHHYSLICQ